MIVTEVIGIVFYKHPYSKRNIGTLVVVYIAVFIKITSPTTHELPY